MDIASIATDVRIHTWPHGQLLHTYKPNTQEGFMKSLSWGKDGSWLVFVPSKGPAEVISVKENLKRLHSIHEIQQPTCAAFQNSTKRNIALGSTTGLVLVYDVKSKNVRKRFPLAPSTVFKLEYCTKDSFLVAACEGGEVLLYNDITYNLSSSYKIPNSRTVSNVRCHPLRRNLVAGGSKEGVVAIWDIHTSKLKFNKQAHSAPVTDLTFSPLRSDLLVTIGLDRKLMFFETSSNKCVMEKVMDRSSTAIDFCLDGIGLAVGLQDGTIQMYDTRKMNSPLHTFTAHGSQIKQLLFRKRAAEESCEFSADVIDSNVVPVQTPKPGNSCDSPGFLFHGDFLPEVPNATVEASAADVADSFLEALGWNLNSTSQGTENQTISRLGIADGAEKPILAENKTQTQVNSSVTGQRVGDENMIWKDNPSVIKIVVDEAKTKTSTSTPKFHQAEHISNLSPILSESQSATAKGLNQINTEVIRSIVREELSSFREELSNFREEWKEKISTLKQDIKFGQYDIMRENRQFFYDLQLYHVKENIKTEARLVQLKEHVAALSSSGDDMLMQENIQLREEVQALRNQLIVNLNNNN